MTAPVLHAGDFSDRDVRFIGFAIEHVIEPLLRFACVAKPFGTDLTPEVVVAALGNMDAKFDALPIATLTSALDAELIDRHMEAGRNARGVYIPAQDANANRLFATLAHESKWFPCLTEYWIIRARKIYARSQHESEV